MTNKLSIKDLREIARRARLDNWQFMKRKNLLKCIKIKDSSVTISPLLPTGVRRPMIIKQQTELPKSAKEARVLAKQYRVSNWWNL